MSTTTTHASESLSVVSLEKLIAEREKLVRETFGKARSKCICGYASSSAVRKPLITVLNDTPVSEALQTLADHDILCAVVTAKGGKQFLGLLNVTDLLLPIVFAPLWAKYEGKTLASVTQQQFEEAQQLKIWSHPVGELLGNSEESKNLWTVTEDVSIAKLCEYFCRGVHRVLVRPCPVPASATAVSVMDIPKGDADTKHGTAVVTMGLPELVSQTDVLLYLQKHRGQFTTLLYKTMLELGLAAQPEHKYEKHGQAPAAAPKYKVVSVLSTVSALEAFRSLRDSTGELAAVPVVGESGVILSNLSASDLRGVTQNNAHLLLLPVLEYLVALRGQLPSLVTCRAGDSLNSVLDKLLAFSVHRAWIVDSRHRVSGCVSMSDIIGKLSATDWHHAPAAAKA